VRAPPGQVRSVPTSSGTQRSSAEQVEPATRHAVRVQLVPDSSGGERGGRSSTAAQIEPAPSSSIKAHLARLNGFSAVQRGDHTPLSSTNQCLACLEDSNGPKPEAERPRSTSQSQVFIAAEERMHAPWFSSARPSLPPPGVAAAPTLELFFQLQPGAILWDEEQESELLTVTVPLHMLQEVAARAADKRATSACAIAAQPVVTPRAEAKLPPPPPMPRAAAAGQQANVVQPAHPNPTLTMANCGASQPTGVWHQSGCFSGSAGGVSCPEQLLRHQAAGSQAHSAPISHLPSSLSQATSISGRAAQGMAARRRAMAPRNMQGLAALSQSLYSKLVAGAAGMAAGAPDGCVPASRRLQPEQPTLQGAGDEAPGAFAEMHAEDA
jgi:hypothetical protein